MCSPHRLTQPLIHGRRIYGELATAQIENVGANVHPHVFRVKVVVSSHMVTVA